MPSSFIKTKRERISSTLAAASSVGLSNPHWRYKMKGAPRHHPEVTMRLETPVIYFYPPKGKAGEAVNRGLITVTRAPASTRVATFRVATSPPPTTTQRRSATRKNTG